MGLINAIFVNIQRPTPFYIGCGDPTFDGILSMQDHLEEVKTIATGGLGWTCATVHGMAVKTEFLADLPNHSLLYLRTEGIIPNDTKNPKGDYVPLVSFMVCNSADGKDRKQVEITPEDVVVYNKDHVYDLVFINACRSADMRHPDSNAQAFANAFNARAYVGYISYQNAYRARQVAAPFFQRLTKHRTVKDAVEYVNSLYLGTPLNVLNDKNIIIDYTPINSNTPNP